MIGKAESISLGPCEKISLHVRTFYVAFFTFWSISLMAKTSLIRDGNDYGSDVLRDFKSEMFRNTTSRTRDKSIPVAGRT